MELQRIEELVLSNDIDRAKAIFELNRDATIIKNALIQYDPKTHGVHDKQIRKDKKLDNGNFVPVTRISLAIQKKIVLLAATFLGNPKLDSSPSEGVEQNMFDAIQETWEENKLDYKFKKVVKRVKSELEAAELWYAVKTDDGFKMRMRLLHNSFDSVSRTGGDSLYPVYDFYNDLIAFGRGYIVKEENDNGEFEDVEYFDIYTAKTFYYLKKNKNGWSFIDTKAQVIDANGQMQAIVYDKGVPNPWGKIPIMYAAQERPEWDDVQEAIDRLEKKTSNHADTNDRFDSPIMLAEGDVEGFDLEKDDTGKLLEAKNGGKASYLTWDNAPESMRMEIENLWKYIHTLTHTPDISFEQMKGIGPVSGVALKLLFMDAHMKASDSEEVFGEFVQRRINFLKTALSVINPALKPAIKMKIKPKFEYFIIKNDQEDVNTLVTAVTGGIMSKETAVKQNPLVVDYEAENELVKAEAEAQQKALGLDNLMNVA